MKILGAVAIATLLLLPGCPRKVKPDEKPTATGLRVTLEEEDTWIAVIRPIEDHLPVEAGLVRALQEASALRFSPDGQPVVIYEGAGRRAVAFPVAGPVRLKPPWVMHRVEGGPVATTLVDGGLRVAAERNDDFLLEVGVLGQNVTGPVLHRILDDPRSTQPDEMRVQLLVSVSPGG